MDGIIVIRHKYYNSIEQRNCNLKETLSGSKKTQDNNVILLKANSCKFFSFKR